MILNVQIMQGYPEPGDLYQGSFSFSYKGIGWMRFAGKCFKRGVEVPWPTNPKLGEGHYDAVTDAHYCWNGDRWSKLGWPDKKPMIRPG